MFKKKQNKTVQEAVLSLGDLRGKLSGCLQPLLSRGVNSQGGSPLSAVACIIPFSAEQKILCSSF